MRSLFNYLFKITHSWQQSTSHQKVMDVLEQLINLTNSENCKSKIENLKSLNLDNILFSLEELADLAYIDRDPQTINVLLQYKLIDKATKFRDGISVEEYLNQAESNTNNPPKSPQIHEDNYVEELCMQLVETWTQGNSRMQQEENNQSNGSTTNEPLQDKHQLAAAALNLSKPKISSINLNRGNNNDEGIDMNSPDDDGFFTPMDGSPQECYCRNPHAHLSGVNTRAEHGELSHDSLESS